MKNPSRKFSAAAAALFALALAACGHSHDNGAGALPTKVYKITPGADAQKNAIIAFFDAHEGDTIEFAEGQYDFTNALTMTGKKGITIRGAGRNKTYLRFAGSNDQDGFNLNRMTGITIQGLTIYDAPGNGLRIFRSDFVTVRDVKVGWSVADDTDNPYGNFTTDQTKWTADGSYAFYPVICHHVLIEDSVSVGSSDAGVYVGQSSDILVRRTVAYHNVAGFEFENTYRAEFVDNEAHDNVGGFLVFDLPGRVQFGEKNIVHRNLSHDNNITSFAPHGAIVGDVPSGTGMLVLASDQLEVYDNDIRDNNTVGLAIVNYGLVNSAEDQRRYDLYPEGMHVYSNVFTSNGGNPQTPKPGDSSCHGQGGLPGLQDVDPNNPTAPIDCFTNNASLLVAIIQVKNLGKTAQIVWDGATDTDSGCTTIPTDNQGVPLTQPNPNDHSRYEARHDERGRPNLYQSDPLPACKYNKWKFNADGSLKVPQNGMCIKDNVFVAPAGLPVDDYANVHFANTDPTDPNNLVPADNTMPEQCPIVEAPLLSQYIPVLGSYTPNPANDPRASDDQLAAVCSAVKPGQINYEALARFNCPHLQDYGLFADPADPTKNPNGFGVPFNLNTILFSDYAVKDRFLFLPPDATGVVQKATYQDHNKCDTINIYDCYTATLGFPTGTVFAKTFAFRNGSTDNVVETRLLIKRAHADGSVYWTGFAYEWKTVNGVRVAELKLEGDTQSVTWNYDDEDTDAKDASGAHLHYQGSAANYGIPNAGACLLCHGGDDREAGTAPIGPKVRNLNKTYDYGGMVGVKNQLDYLQSKGLLDLPAGKTPADLEHLAKFAVIGSGDPANADNDKHLRARAFLEVNCMHCHNGAGAAQNSGLGFESFTEPMGEGQGICKSPTAAGKAANNADYDIVPGNSSGSLLAVRLTSTQPGIKMPPLARTVTQTEAVNLITDWIDNVVAAHADAKAAKVCSSSTAPAVPFMMAPLPVVPPTAAQTRPWG